MGGDCAMRSIFLLSLALVLLSSSIAFGSDFCGRVGDFTENVAEMKASGSSISDVIAQLRTFNLSPSHFKFDEGLIENIYLGPQTSKMTPPQIRAHYGRECQHDGWKPIP